MIIGITGKNAAGKGEAAKYFEKKGFEYFSLSDVIRDELKEKGIEPARENLISHGNHLREKHGAGVLAKKIISKIKNDSVVDSIRNPEEIMQLRKLKEFILIGIDAPVEIRFKRSLKRARAGDAKTLEEFKAIEEKENFKNTTGQQLDKCISMADKVIINDGSLEELHGKLGGILHEKANLG